ncbi:hypothetical protein LBSP_22820 [Lentilactobacillus buchneri subsp. silagei]|uniref:YozE family protein n=1 Tax=Lentilactobacillus buchneri TaxID=1581 RepID=UPI0012E4F66E|nr:YozE family protein [Lentilactobacillus buchneri]GED95722.1 hypothetical protein LBSP_22820 [Lentilactobacillus buchneri subsp. silagei]
MDFYNWLMRFKDVSLPIGDVARKIRSDRSFPKGNLDWKALKKYLKSIDFSNSELEIVKNIFNYYLAEKSR